MSRADGYFEAWTNAIREKTGIDGRQAMAAITQVMQREVRGNVQWAGSQAKGTGIDGSDLDMCVTTPEPVSEAQRRALATAVREALHRETRVCWHVIRVQRDHRRPKIDIAFANAAFGSRRTPDTGDFKGQPQRQQAARALKAWARTWGFGWVSGWALERVVVHLDSARQPTALALTVAALTWLAERANPSAVESILRPHAEPRWHDDWSQKLPGRVEALRNAARATLSRHAPDAWTSADNAERWLATR